MMSIALRSWFERMIERGLRVFGDVHTISGVDYCNMTSRNDEEIRANLAAAIELVRTQPEASEFVLHEIKLLAASSRTERTLLHAGVCLTAFAGRGRSEPLYLATHLIGVASMISHSRSQLEYGARLGHDELRRRSAERQLEFLSELGAEPPWMASIRRRAD